VDLFHGLSQELEFFLKDQLARDRAGASESVLRGFQHFMFLRESSKPAGDDDEIWRFYLGSRSRDSANRCLALSHSATVACIRSNRISSQSLVLMDRVCMRHGSMKGEPIE